MKKKLILAAVIGGMLLACNNGSPSPELKLGRTKHFVIVTLPYSSKQALLLYRETYGDSLVGLTFKNVKSRWLIDVADTVRVNGVPVIDSITNQPKTVIVPHVVNIPDSTIFVVNEMNFDSLMDRNTNLIKH